MHRVTDSLASVAFFLIALPIALVLTVCALVADMVVSLRNIWS